MSRRSFAGVAALLSALALAFGATAITTTSDPTVVANPCCTGHK